MRAFTTLLLLALAVPAVAQEQEIRSANLPRTLERELFRMYDGAAERLDGPHTVGRMQVVRGDVAATGGPLRVEGRIIGNVAMVNGDVLIEPGGSVTGTVTVVGGEVRLADEASVGGSITAYASSSSRTARVEDGEDDWDWDDRDDDDWWPRRRDRWSRGYSRLTLRTGASYNRVEGLPILFGPVIQTAGANHLRVEAMAIWRSESRTLNTDRMGYQIRAEQFMAGRHLSVGGSAFSVVDPMDRWQVSDLEASLATAVFHDDYRDHYGRTGWSAFVGVHPIRSLEAKVEYRQEEHEAIAAGDPWSLFHRGDVWRHQPLVAEGELDVLAGSLELDLRGPRKEARNGWYARLAVERPVDGSLTRQALLGGIPADGTPFGDDPAEVTPGTFIPATDLSTDFTTAQVDLRRYNAVGYSSQLNLRFMAGGNVDEGPLPPQYQHALGGIGTLPGFPTFHADCGARSLVGRSGDDRFFPAYGCDRFALAQVEYRGDLSLGFGFGEPDRYDDDWWDDVDLDFIPTWVVFMDAARGWGYDDPALGGDRDTGTLVDAGLGFLIEDLGIYAALPLNGSVPQEPRFFIRLGRRF